MKNSLKLLTLAAGIALIAGTTTSCTTTEAAIVGGIAGAALGVALADDHGGHYGHGGHGHGGGHYGYRGGYGYGGGGHCY